MGKHLGHENSGIPIENDHSGCAWHIRRVIRYRDLAHSVKKRFPYKRSHKSSIGNEASVPGHDNFQHQNEADMDNPIVEKKTRQSTSASKHSVKARLRALITEDISIKKRRHRRSETCPAQFTRSDSVHQLESSHQNAEIHHGYPTNGQSIKPSSANSPQDLHPSNSGKNSICDERCQACNTMISWNELGHIHVDECRTPVVENDTGKEDYGLLNPEELTADYSFHHSKEVLDALDIIYFNEDQNSPLAHVHNHQTLRGKMKLSKSISLPSIEFLSIRDSEFNKLRYKQQEIDFPTKEKGKFQDGSQSRVSDTSKSREYSHQLSMPSGYRMHGIVQQILHMAEIADNSPPGSANQLKNQGKNQVVIKHFKNLKEKIKHVIKESRKERYRITMDAVLDKVPRGSGFSKESMEIANQVKGSILNEDVEESHTCRNKSEHSAPSSRKDIVRHFRRSSSLNESLDRYCQLYECSFKRESKSHTTDTGKIGTKEADTPSRNTPKILGRISSLPNIRSYGCQDEDSLANMNGKKRVDHSIASESSPDLAMRDKNETQEMLVEVSEVNSICDDSKKSTSPSKSETTDSVSHCENEDDLIRKLAIQFEEPTTVSLIGSSEVDTVNSATFSSSEGFEPRHLPKGLELVTNQLQEAPMDTSTVPDSQVDIPVIVDTFHLHVDEKDKAEFNYVRDVLRISGFSKNDTFGTWYSDSQPVDLSVYEELESCLLLDPDCSGNQEGGNCNHLLLFDLINEVLIEMYHRSHTYCPMPLSSLSHIQTVPVGSHILKEVWTSISWYLSSRMGLNQSLDYLVTRDLAKGDGWLNLQYDSECVGLELEDMIFDDLLDEFCWN